MNWEGSKSGCDSRWGTTPAFAMQELRTTKCLRQVPLPRGKDLILRPQHSTTLCAQCILLITANCDTDCTHYIK